MTEITEIPEEDRAALREALLTWKANGVEHPLIPLDVDIDGDGITDSFGLDENDELVLVPGVALESTVYLSEGDDIREGDG